MLLAVYSPFIGGLPNDNGTIRLAATSSYNGSLSYRVGSADGRNWEPAAGRCGR